MMFHIKDRREAAMGIPVSTTHTISLAIIGVGRHYPRFGGCRGRLLLVSSINR